MFGLPGGGDGGQAEGQRGFADRAMLVVRTGSDTAPRARMWWEQVASTATFSRPPCCSAFVPPPLPAPPLLDEATKKQLVSFQGPRLLKNKSKTFLVVQWLRICLPMQRTWIRSLVPEDASCCGTTIPMCYSY